MPIAVTMCSIITMPVTTMVTIGVLHVVPVNRRTRCGRNHHWSWRAVPWINCHRWRRYDDRRMPILIAQRNAEAHTGARLRRSGQNRNCNCTNKE